MCWCVSNKIKWKFERLKLKQFGICQLLYEGTIYLLRFVVVFCYIFFVFGSHSENEIEKEWKQVNSRLQKKNEEKITITRKTFMSSKQSTYTTAQRPEHMKAEYPPPTLKNDIFAKSTHVNMFKCIDVKGNSNTYYTAVSLYANKE